MMYDLLIQHAEVIDGTGAPRRRENVAVKNGTIFFAGTEAEALKTIDGRGMVLCPGFIDVHSHGDLVAGHDYARLCKTSQGITTEIAGQCGSSFFPVTEETKDMVAANALMLGDLEREHMGEFRNMRELAAFLGRQELSANMMVFMGHSTLRMAVMGNSDRKASEAELCRMEELLTEAMESGCAGISTGLFYPPSAYGDVDEVSRLCAVVKRYGGIHTTHMRNEGSGILESIDEVLEVSRRTGVSLNISHHKVCGKKNWGLSGQTLKKIKEARSEGLSVTADVYPYTASMTKLAACIPAEYFTKGTEWLMSALKDKKIRKEIREKMEAYEDGRYRQCGGFDGILIGGCPKRPEADGKRISEYARELGADPFEVFFDLVEEIGSQCSAIYFSMGDEDLFRIVSAPFTMIGTDGLTISMDGKTHPRSWGTFPRAIRLFVREQRLMSLEAMIHKMTGLPAATYHLASKGRIADGMDADLVLFDEKDISDEADYVCSNRLSAGIKAVIAGGKIVCEENRMTGEYPGIFLPFRP